MIAEQELLEEKIINLSIDWFTKNWIHYVVIGGDGVLSLAGIELSYKKYIEEQLEEINK